MPLANNNKSGFTLVELSIVLVIIGLIIGGVLVGRDLIKSATIRAQIKQIEEYNSAVNSFRIKYNALPGDMDRSKTAAFGFFTMSIPAAGALSYCNCWGDGNDLIQAQEGNGTDISWSTGGVTYHQFSAFDGETLAFWRHLSEAGLIAGNYGSDLISSGGYVPSDTTATTTGKYIPSAKLGNGNNVTIAAWQGHHFFNIVSVTKIPANAGIASQVVANRISPVDAYNIDSKIDDGYPDTGIVQAADLAFMGALYHTYYIALPQPVEAAQGTSSCVVTGDTDYQLTINDLKCSLRIQAQF